jgi:hypothetical protein
MSKNNIASQLVSLQKNPLKQAITKTINYHRAFKRVIANKSKEATLIGDRTNTISEVVHRRKKKINTNSIEASSICSIIDIILRRKIITSK